MVDREATIVALWTALNRQDVEAAAALLHPDVDWQDLIHGGRRTGPAAVRDYWNAVFALIRPETTALEFTTESDDRVAVKVDHHICDPKGVFWADEIVTHRFAFRDGLIVRMDVI